MFDAAGGRVASAGREYRLSHPAPDHVEIDAGTWWEAAVAAVREALAAPGVDPSAVAGLAVSSQGESVVAVDASGRPLGPALVWLDNRATDEARELSERFAPDLVYERTGVPDINPTWTAAKLLWWRRHDPALFAGAARFLLAQDARAPPADRPLRDQRRPLVHDPAARHPRRRLVARDARRGRRRSRAAARARPDGVHRRHPDTPSAAEALGLPAGLAGRRGRDGPGHRRGRASATSPRGWSRRAPAGR